MWGTWCGREVEFYSRCGELVAPLTWAQVQAICGRRVQAHAIATKAAFARMMGPFPFVKRAMLAVRPFQKVWRTEGMAWWWATTISRPLTSPLPW